MNLETYAAEAEIEKDHWWFVGRRALFARVIESLQLPRDARILDAGTSTGTNLRLLRGLDFTRVDGVDLSDEAIRYCAMKDLGHVTRGDLCDLPFASGQFDLALATDVIEHLDDDRRALAELERVLKPGGHALISVPAFPSLWGKQDEVAQHKRRYRRRPLQAAIQEAGLECLDVFHFNYLLFAPIWLARQVIRLFDIKLR